jgi:hypothetical protein
MLAVAPPLKVNARLKADAARIEAGNIDIIPPDMRAPRTIALDVEGEKGCQAVCRKLLGMDLADRVVTPLETGAGQAPGTLKVAFRLADAQVCKDAGGEPGTTEAAGAPCILRSLEPDPKIDVLLKVSHLAKDERRYEMDRQRMNPFSPGRQTVEVLELWPCSNAENCAPLVRRVYVQQQRLVTPLVLLLDDNSPGMAANRAWARTNYGVAADPAAFLASKWPARGNSMDASRLEIVFDTATLAKTDTLDQDPEGLSLAIRRIEDGAGPLTPVERTLLQRLFDGRGPRISGTGLARRPEVAEAVKTRLGDLLMAQRGQDSEMLWLTEHLIADLPTDDYRRLRPALMRWLTDPGPLAAGTNNPRFLIRLSDLGPVIVEPLIQGMFHPGVPVAPDRSQRENTATITALCLVGDPRAAPELHRRKDAITNPRGNELPALNTALDHIEGRAPKGACLTLLPTDPGPDDGWNRRFAEARHIEPISP